MAKSLSLIPGLILGLAVILTPAWSLIDVAKAVPFLSGDTEVNVRKDKVTGNSIPEESKPVAGSECQDSKGEWKKIQPDHPGIHFHGAKYIYRTDSAIHIERFPDSLLSLSKTQIKFSPVKARTLAGVLISFMTNSQKIKARFGVVEGENRGSIFGIFQNGNFTDSVNFSQNDGPVLSFELTPENPGTETVYEISLPHWANTEFLGLDIDASSALESDYIPVRKKVYVAYGNSITHGTGQSAAFETYPFLVSRKMGWELYNLAVGGAKTSQSIAEMIRDDFDHIDYMTILIGYNDYNNEGITAEDYEKRLEDFITAVRSKHTQTEICCITHTYTTQTESKLTAITIDDFRQKVAEVYKKLHDGGDSNIYLIRGENISSETNLRDAVHFHAYGAKLFADSLCSRITSLIKREEMVGENKCQ